MTPAFSRLSRRREQADCDSPTFSARAALGMRPSCCSASSMAISILSSDILRISFLVIEIGCKKIRTLYRRAHHFANTCEAVCDFLGMLDRLLRSCRMRVGCPKEIKDHEYRVGLTPGAAREYVAHGHQVLVETGAGAGIGAGDDAYREAGAASRGADPLHLSASRPGSRTDEGSA